MDAFGNFTKQPFEVGRRCEVGRLRRLSVCVFIRLACLLAGLMCFCLRGGRRIKSSVHFGNSCLPLVQLSIESTNLAQVATLKSGKLAAKIDKLQLAFRESRADGSQLLAL